MRCPKCQYISFDTGDRCRNCGYQLSLSPEIEPLDLPIQTGEEPEGPLQDLRLDARRDRSVLPADNAELPAAASSDLANASTRTAGRRPAAAALDLPLFGDRSLHDDTPLVSAPAVPRPPLAVRKPAAALSKATAAKVEVRRKVHSEPELDLQAPEQHPVTFPHSAIAGERTAALEPDALAAPPSLRLLAAMIDLLVIGSIDATVLHFTLKICGLAYSEIAVLPVAPFAAFLVLLNGGYFVLFTAAGGQTIGKMIARLKVIPANRQNWHDRVPFGQAVLRSAAYLVSALPAGLGFLPGLVGADKRAVHDRLAHTRVVRM